MHTTHPNLEFTDPSKSDSTAHPTKLDVGGRMHCQIGHYVPQAKKSDGRGRTHDLTGKDRSQHYPNPKLDFAGPSKFNSRGRAQTKSDSRIVDPNKSDTKGRRPYKIGNSKISPSPNPIGHCRSTARPNQAQPNRPARSFEVAYERSEAAPKGTPRTQVQPRRILDSAHSIKSAI